MSNLSTHISTSVLIVDDEQPVRNLFSRVLTEAGYDVSIAANGKIALELIQNSKFDLILLDLIMPEVDGIEVLQKLSKSKTRAKVIAMSGMFDSQFLRVAQHLGAATAIYKPIALDTLLNIIQQTLRLETVEESLRHV